MKILVCIIVFLVLLVSITFALSMAKISKRADEKMPTLLSIDSEDR